MLGLYREEMDHPETTDQKLAELIVPKKRQLGDDVGTFRRPGVGGRELPGTRSR